MCQNAHSTHSLAQDVLCEQWYSLVQWCQSQLTSPATPTPCPANRFSEPYAPSLAVVYK